MNDKVLIDWIYNGMPCLACGERVFMECTIGGDEGGNTTLVMKGECDPCSASPIGRNPMMLMIGGKE